MSGQISPDEHVERQVVAWYLVHRYGDPRASLLAPEHVRHPALRAAWESARSRRDGGWTVWDLGLSPGLVGEIGSTSPPSRREVAELERRVVAAWGARRLLESVGAALDDVRSGKVDSLEDALGRVRRACGEAEAGCLSRATSHAEAGVEAFTDWRESLNRGAVIPMPLRRIQELVGGWVRGKLWMIGAITSGHKTTMARMAAWHAAKAGHRALLWTMEDTRQHVATRTLAAEIREVDTRMFAVGHKPAITGDDFEVVLRKLSQHLDGDAAKRLHYLDEGQPKLSRVLGLVSAEVAQGVQFVALDFMQLIRPDAKPLSDEGHWYDVANGLANLAKQLNVPIVCCVQPTQAAQREQLNTGHTLTLSDLRGAAAISQAAWGVMLLNACGDTDQATKRWRRNPRKIQITIAKNKAGAYGGGTFGVIPEHDMITDEEPYAR